MGVFVPSFGCSPPKPFSRPGLASVLCCFSSCLLVAVYNLLALWSLVVLVLLVAVGCGFFFL